jgi:DNA-binding MarR family transcriptional regulator
MSSATRTTDDAFQDVLLALFQLHGSVLEAADAMSGGFGLTGARWQVLKVAARQSLTVSQIALRLGLKRQSVQRTVDQLAALRLVELQPNVHHQRAGLVSLPARARPHGPRASRRVARRAHRAGRGGHGARTRRRSTPHQSHLQTLGSGPMIPTLLILKWAHIIAMVYCPRS